MAEHDEKIRIEEQYNPSDKAAEIIAEVYRDFYQFRNNRNSGGMKQLQGHDFEDYLRKSRELFWTSTSTQSEDLKQLNLEFAIPFVRKETIDFVSRLTSLNIAPHIHGDGLSQYEVKVLQAIYKKWRLKSVDRVEKFWEILYGVVNGTSCSYVGYDGGKSKKRYLTKYDPDLGEYEIDEKEVRHWDDVTNEVVPLEEIYLKKIWERNIQKQGKVIRKQEISRSEFEKLYPENIYPNAKFVYEGKRIAEDSLFYQLLKGAGVTTLDKIQILTLWDTDSDKKVAVANGVWLNPVGKRNNEQASPNPFNHKMMPFKWAQLFQPIDEKFAYGLSLPFMVKDQHKLLNMSFTMLMESELRAIDPPYLSSDIEAPDLVFGQKKVIPVTDVNAFKQLEVKEPSQQFFTTMNSLQSNMQAQAQGGSSQVIPSIQPKSAREVVQMEQMKNQAMGSTLTMYYDLIYQEIMLILKTALQFYAANRYSDGDVLKTITVPDFPMSKGGIGRMEVRITKKPDNALKLFFDAINKTNETGKLTEIVEIDPETLNKLEFFIDKINLEPERTTEMERTLFFEQVLQPMLNVFIPMGMADPSKVFLRWLEKFGEHPADYASDQAIPQLLNNWGNGKFGPFINPQQQQGMGTGAGMQNIGQQTGNMMQSQIGQRFGDQSNGGMGQMADMMQQGQSPLQ